jgi:hypothetical protein
MRAWIHVRLGTQESSDLLCPSSETRAGQPWDIVYQSKALKVMNWVTLLVCIDLSCGTLVERRLSRGRHHRDRLRAPKNFRCDFLIIFFWVFGSRPISSQRVDTFPESPVLFDNFVQRFYTKFLLCFLNLWISTPPLEIMKLTPD